jgi:transcriptional regulator NrdR family protein
MDSRGGPNNSIRRRRMCVAGHCAHRFTTYELELDSSPIVSTEHLAAEVRRRLQTAIDVLKPLGDFADVLEQLGKLPK